MFVNATDNYLELAARFVVPVRRARSVQLGVNRTTIVVHLDRRGVERRRSVRKMTDRSIRRAAKIYGSGEPLKVAAAPFDVDAKTLAREFRRAGVPIRRRRGWPPST